MFSEFDRLLIKDGIARQPNCFGNFHKHAIKYAKNLKVKPNERDYFSNSMENFFNV